MNHDLIIEQIQRIEESALFANASKQKSFLRFVVEKSLSGDLDELKESVIGVQVYGRRPDYDPRIDPTVRVEAGKLRNRLSEYFAGEGASDPVVITIPKGSYKPEFVWKNHDPGPSRERRPYWAAGVAFVVLACLGIAGWRLSAGATRPAAVSGFLNLVACDAGAIFAVRPDGDLYLYRHLWRQNLSVMDNRGLPLTVGHGWADFREVGCAGSGQLLAVTRDGRLLWYRTTLPNGPANWDIRSGTHVASGWTKVETVAVGQDGSVFTREPSGVLRYQQLAERNGLMGWPVSQTTVPGSWNHCRQIASAGSGVFYCLDGQGKLTWHRALASGPTAELAAASGAVLASGWGRFIKLLAAPDGVLYALTASGELHWFRRDPADPGAPWDKDSGTVAGRGFVLATREPPPA